MPQKRIFLGIVITVLAIPTIAFFSAYFSKEVLLLFKIGSTFANSDFFIGIGSAFVGTIGAAGLIYYFQYQHKQLEKVGSINFALAIISGHITTLLNTKIQHLIPLKEEKDSALRTIEQARIIRETLGVSNPTRLDIKYMTQHIHFSAQDFLIGLEKLTPFAEQFPKAIVYAMQAKKSLETLRDIFVEWNKYVKEIMETTPENYGRIFGLPFERGRDTRFIDTVENLHKETDNCLFFLQLFEEELQKMSKKILPKKFSRKIIKLKTIDKYTQYLPSKSFVEGWKDN